MQLHHLETHWQDAHVHHNNHKLKIYYTKKKTLCGYHTQVFACDAHDCIKLF